MPVFKFLLQEFVSVSFGEINWIFYEDFFWNFGSFFQQPVSHVYDLSCFLSYLLNILPRKYGTAKDFFYIIISIEKLLNLQIIFNFRDLFRNSLNFESEKIY